MFVKENFVKKIFGQKFGRNKKQGKQILLVKKFWVKKKIGKTYFLGQKMVGSKKLLGRKKCWLKTFFGQIFLTKKFI